MFNRKKRRKENRAVKHIGKTISVLWQRCSGLLFIAVLNLIKYDKTQTGRNSLERLLMAKNEEETEKRRGKILEDINGWNIEIYYMYI